MIWLFAKSEPSVFLQLTPGKFGVVCRTKATGQEVQGRRGKGQLPSKAGTAELCFEYDMSVYTQPREGVGVGGGGVNLQRLKTRWFSVLDELH